MIGGMNIVLVAAVADNSVIGAKGGMPWRLKSDLAHFRALTIGKPVIMGRKTYESIGKPLDQRDNIVISRQAGYAGPGVHVVVSIPEAIALARRLAAGRGVEEIAVIGGADIFRAMLSMADRIYLTRVHGAPAGDVALEPFDATEWKEVAREPMAKTSGDQFTADFIVLDRQDLILPR